MKRVATALVLIPAVVWVVLYAPKWAFLAVTALVGLLAHREFDGIVAAHGVARGGWIAAVLGLALLLAPEGWFATVLILAALAFLALAMRVSDLAGALTAAAAGLLGIVYIFGAWRAGSGLREISPHWLMVTLVVSWAGDTAAYYAGRAIGKHKLAPRISPGKTWEGALGSVVGGVTAAALYAYYLIPAAALGTVLGVGAAANVAGQVGDLAESAIKRGAGVKDSGSSLPGHGGWLDRIDSSLFAIPVAYAVVRALV